MKIVVAFDSFKGSLSARDAGTIAARALKNAGHTVVVKPLGDGGEGTAEAVLAARNGEWIPVRVMGPLPDMPLESGYAWFPDDRSALIEMASASGLTHLRPEQLNPLRTTTFGTGQLIQAALTKNPIALTISETLPVSLFGGLMIVMSLTPAIFAGIAPIKTVEG